MDQDVYVMPVVEDYGDLRDLTRANANADQEDGGAKPPFFDGSDVQ